MINGNSAPNTDPFDNIMSHISMMTEINFQDQDEEVPSYTVQVQLRKE
jgi:hypothetical protein